MILTPERIAEMDKITGRTTVVNSINPVAKKRADEIRALKPLEAPIVTAGRETVSDFEKYGQEIKETFSNIPEKAIEASKDAEGKSTVLRSVLAAPAVAGQALGKTAGTIAKATGSLFMLPINTFIEGFKRDNPEVAEKIKSSQGVQDIKELFNPENLTPEARKMIENLSEKAKKYPDVTQSLVDFAEVYLLGKVPAAEKQIVDKSKKVFNAIEESIPTAPIVEKSMQKTFEQSIEESKKILNPSQKYTPTEIERLRQRGEIKTEGKGIFKKEVADTKTTLQDETLATLVQEGKISSKKLPSENTKIIKQEARINDANIDEIVNRPELNKPFTKSTINKVFKEVENSAKKDLVFVADSTEEKIYRAVLDVAKEEVTKNSLNNSGLRKSIKAFNARMEEILGKDIYGGAEESVGKARLQAAKDVRKKLNDFLADNLESPPIVKDKALSGQKVVNKLPSSTEYTTGRIQGGGIYKNQLQREAQLLNAADEISYRTRGSLNKTEIKKWFDAHPNVKRLTKYGGATVGGGILLDSLTN